MDETQCEHEGCTERAETYTLDGPDANGEWIPQLFHFCEDHAAEFGFCPVCGAFVGGVEADIIPMAKYGVCANCLEELNDVTDYGPTVYFDLDDAEYDDLRDMFG